MSEKQKELECLVSWVQFYKMNNQTGSENVARIQLKQLEEEMKP